MPSPPQEHHNAAVFARKETRVEVDLKDRQSDIQSRTIVFDLPVGVIVTVMELHVKYPSSLLNLAGARHAVQLIGRGKPIPVNVTDVPLKEISAIQYQSMNIRNDALELKAHYSARGSATMALFGADWPIAEVIRLSSWRFATESILHCDLANFLGVEDTVKLSTTPCTNPGSDSSFYTIEGVQIDMKKTSVDVEKFIVDFLECTGEAYTEEH